MPSPSSVLLRTQSDERLVALVRSGHERAFDAIVERYRRPLLRACRRILPEARAEDALQQALVAAWKGLERGDDVQELRPWLYRITRNTALNQLRVAGYDLDELVDTLAASADPEEEVMRRAVVRQTLAAVAALPDRQREALLRTALDGHGQDEVARDLGLSDTALRALVHRARVRVRATATALVPLPLAVSWATAGGGAGAVATAAKAGTVIALAGGAAATPALIHHGPADPRRQHAARSDDAHRLSPATPADPASTPTPGATPAAPRVVAVKSAATPVRTAPAGSDRQDRDESRAGDRDDSPNAYERDEADDREPGHDGGDDVRDVGEQEEHAARDDEGGRERQGDDDDGGSEGGGRDDESDDERPSAPVSAPTPVATPLKLQQQSGDEDASEERRDSGHGASDSPGGDEDD